MIKTKTIFCLLNTHQFSLLPCTFEAFGWLVEV